MTKVKLGDVANFINGGAWNQSEYTETGVPVVRVSDIHNATVDLSDCKYLPTTAIKKYAKNKLEKGDLVICTVGSHATQPNSVVGRPGIIPASCQGALLNQNAVCIRPKVELIDKVWLGYLARSQEMKDYIIAHARGSASQVRMAISALKNFEFELPPLSEQIETSTILSNYDDLIANNNQRIAILENMAQSLYREWFVNFRYPNHEDNLDADGNQKFVDSPLGQIPEGWEVKTAAEAITINPRTKLAKEGEKPFVGMSGLSESSMVISDIIEKSGNSGAKFINGDTLFARITPCLQNGKTGYVQFLNQEQPVGFGSTEFIVLRESEDLSSEYIYLLSRSNNFREHAIKSMTGATGRQRVHPDSFASYYLAVPPKMVMNEFTKLVKPMFKSIFNLSQRNQNLKQQRDMLLPKLISGQIER